MNARFVGLGGRGWVAGFLALTLTACGGGGGSGDPGGGGGGGGGGGDPTVSLVAKSTFTAEDVAHLLTRTRFGLNTADYTAVSTMGVPAFVDAMLVLPQNTAVEQAATTSEIEDPAFPQEHELVRWWLRVMQETQHPFQEVLALFWHDHFATSQTILGGDKKYWWPNHLNLFRYGGTGNLRTMLNAVALDWTMLEWLDGVRSSRNSPNENFAREFWELFTLGVDNGYTQADIVQAAKCFTGFRTRFDDTTAAVLRRIRREPPQHHEQDGAGHDDHGPHGRRRRERVRRHGERDAREPPRGGIRLQAALRALLLPQRAAGGRRPAGRAAAGLQLRARAGAARDPDVRGLLLDGVEVEPGEEPDRRRDGLPARHRHARAHGRHRRRRRRRGHAPHDAAQRERLDGRRVLALRPGDGRARELRGRLRQPPRAGRADGPGPAPAAAQRQHLDAPR